MILRSILPFTFLAAITFSSEAQKLKVKRKGVAPLDVTTKTTVAAVIPQTPAIYSIRQLTGKWQEVSRATSNTNAPLDFKDTLFYTFSGRGEVHSRQGVSMSLMGEALIEPGNVLVAAADVFTIRSMNNHQVILDDGEYLRTMARKSNFWHETFPTNAVTVEKFITPVSVNASALSGKWKIYRRAAEPGTTDKVLIRILDVQQLKDDNTATGQITFYRSEKLVTLPGTITIKGENISIVTENNTWNMKVYKADGKELVFGDGSLMYYAKPF